MCYTFFSNRQGGQISAMRKRTYEASYAAKREICAALKKLMAQKPLGKITITELMKNSGMARQHFYYHFEDLYDAVRWMFDEEAVALLRRHGGVMLWRDGLLQLFEYLQENRAVCLCALRSMGRDHLRRFFETDIQTMIQNTIQMIASELCCPMEEWELGVLTQFYIGALSSMMEDWLLGKIEGTPQQLIDFVDRMLRDYIRGAAIRLTGRLPDGGALPGLGE